LLFKLDKKGKRREKGIRNREQGTGRREQGEGRREQGEGRREQGEGDSRQIGGRIVSDNNPIIVYYQKQYLLINYNLKI